MKFRFGMFITWQNCIIGSHFSSFSVRIRPSGGRVFRGAKSEKSRPSDLDWSQLRWTGGLTLGRFHHGLVYQKETDPQSALHSRLQVLAEAAARPVWENRLEGLL